MTRLIFVFLAFTATLHGSVGVDTTSRRPTSSHSSNVFGDMSIVDLLKHVVAQPEAFGNWNQIGDFVLDIVRDELKIQGKEQITIPDVDKILSRKLGFINLSGHFTAEQGWFKNLSTLYRNGDVIVTNDDDVFTLKCTLGLKDVMLGYDRYTFKVLRLGPSGHFVGTVGKNSIDIVVDLDLSHGKCKAMLKELRLIELDEISVTLNGFGFMNNIVSRLANEAIERHKTVIVKSVELNLAIEVGKALEKINCDHIFTYMLNRPSV